jgi:hypothetical protein
MRHQEDSSVYIADDGCMFVRKSDDFVMGDRLDLGVGDSMDNYDERHFSKGERDAFLRSLGILNDDCDAVNEEKI